MSDKFVKDIMEIINREVEKSADIWRSKLKDAYRERDRYQKGWQEERKKTEALQSENEKLKKGYERLENWRKAYPLAVFPKINKMEWQIIADVLKRHNINLDRISADNMRHVLDGIKDIVAEALKETEE
jgi:hypothetical protein